MVPESGIIEPGLNGSADSPFCPITATLTSTGTSSPSPKKVSIRIPSAGDSRSNAALSVSYEKRMSPAEILSPAALNHRVMIHVSTDCPCFGIVTGMAITDLVCKLVNISEIKIQMIELHLIINQKVQK